MINIKRAGYLARARHSVASKSLAVLLMGAAVSAFMSAMAVFAAPGDITTVITQTDGTPSFDATDGAGLDSGPNNGIVRTNDTITYNVDIRVVPAQNNVTLVMELPQGTEMTALPAFCDAGSSISPQTLPAPTVPVTMTSYQSLPIQTLTCNVGAMTANSSFIYPISVRVRPEAPNTTVLSLSSVTVHSDEDPTLVQATPLPLQTTVSARAQYDLSKNGTAGTPNSGYVADTGMVPCSGDASKQCWRRSVSILISAPTGGKGISPLSSPINFQDDLSPDSLYPATYSSDPDWIAAGAGALSKYGARLTNCATAPFYGAPGPKIGGALTAQNSVRDSGTISCNQSAGPGSPVQISITNSDTTAYTYPTNTTNPGNPLPADKAYVVAAVISYDVPLDAIRDLGIQTSNANGSVWTLNTNNQFKNFTPTGIDGTANLERDLTNNSRTISYISSNTGGFDTAFIGVPNYPGNTPPGTFAPGNSFQGEGPPGSDLRRSGNTSAMATQPVISSQYINLSNPATTDPIGVMTCQSWDNTKLWLKADNYEVSSSGVQGQGVASNGQAVWLSGMVDRAAPTQQVSVPLMVLYGGGAVGGSGAASACDETSSSVGWFSDPAAVPGNDPAKAAQGVYTGITRVRVYMQVPYTAAGHVGLISMGQVIADDPGPVGTRVPTYGAVKFSFNNTPYDQLLDSTTHPWTLSSYNPDPHSGTLGDRFTIVQSTVRITKQVKKSTDANYGTAIVPVTGGDEVDYRLNPTHTAAVSTGTRETVIVEDCLPVGQSYVLGSSSVTPTMVQATVPADADITCDSGATYIRWELTDHLINEAIPPITFRALVIDTAMPGTYTNTTRISSEGDQASTVQQRSSSAQVQITQPAGIKISKVSLTPLNQVNPAGSNSSSEVQWRVQFANINSPSAPVNVDIIDVLPKNGLDTSRFSGTHTFTSAVIEQGSTPTQPVTILYSADATVNPDPTDPSNAAGSATTTWCSAASGGTPVIGTGSCPTSEQNVTALRLLRPGEFVSGEVISLLLTTTSTANRVDDWYDNQTAGAAGNLLPVGPVHAYSRVIGSSIGDTVWLDTNKDGIKDPGENGIPNVSVTLTGVDDLGNQLVPFTVITDENGQYSFTNLRAGQYRVTVNSSTLPEGAYAVYSLGGGLTTPSNDSLEFTLGQNQQRIDVDFGFYQTPPPNTGISGVISDISNIPGTLAYTGQAWSLYVMTGLAIIAGASGLQVIRKRQLRHI